MAVRRKQRGTTHAGEGAGSAGGGAPDVPRPVELQQPAGNAQQEPVDLEACRRCQLWQNATQGVPGQGPGRASILVVGEQPGSEEDLQGLPFVGPAGRLLDSAFEEAGLSRKAVFVTNAVKHFKYELRGKRRMHKTPAQREVLACSYWLSRELDRVRPRVIITLGATALRAVHTEFQGTLGGVLGKTLEQDGRYVLPTYHPSYALRLRDKGERAAVMESIVATLRKAQALVNEGT